MFHHLSATIQQHIGSSAKTKEKNALIQQINICSFYYVLCYSLHKKLSNAENLFKKSSFLCKNLRICMQWLTKNIIKNSGINSGNALSSFSTSYGKKQTLASNYPLPKVLYYRLMFLMFMVNGYGDANGCSVKIIIKRYIFSYYFPTEALFLCCIMSVSLPPLLVWYVYSVFERNDKMFITTSFLEGTCGFLLLESA